VFEDTFPSGLAPNWFAGPKPSKDGGHFGAAFFAPLGYADHNPYEIKGEGLVIRAKHMPETWADPRGWQTDPSRKWISGLIATAKWDGTKRTVTKSFRTGYFEARMKVPKGKGAWPAFWLLNEWSIDEGSTKGAVEVDIIEGYMHDTRTYRTTVHDWRPDGHNEIATSADTRLADYSADFHLFGAEVTQTEIVWYFDRREVFRAPLPKADKIDPFFLLLNLGMSADWPIEVPAGGYLDLLVDYVRVYQ
jgi:beta-glucanase (GH16 family)